MIKIEESQRRHWLMENNLFRRVYGSLLLFDHSGWSNPSSVGVLVLFMSPTSSILVNSDLRF